MATVRLKFFPPVIGITSILSLLVCIAGYFVFNLNQNGLPPLSLTGIYPPTKYLFQGSMMIVGLILVVGSLVLNSAVNYQVNSILRGDNGEKSIKCCFCLPLKLANRIRCFFVFLSGVGLFGLALVPILETDRYGNDWQVWNISFYIHLTFTSIFFLSSVVHMISGTIITFIIQRELKEKKIWFVIKLITTIVALFGYPILPMLIGLLVIVVCGNSFESCALYKAHVMVLNPLVQYLAVLGIIAYLSTFIYELKHASISINGDSDLEIFAQMGMELDHTEDAFLEVSGSDEEKMSHQGNEKQSEES